MPGLGISLGIGAGGGGGGGGIANPAPVDAAATGAVAQLRTSLKGALTWSKLSGASTIAISAAGVVSLSGALGAGGSASAVVRVQNTASDAIEKAVTIRAAVKPAPAPTPTPVPTPTPTPARLKTAMVQNRAPTFHTGSTGRTRCYTRWPLVAGGDLSSLVVDMTATYISDPGNNIATYDLIEMSIEDTTSGVVVPVTFSGQRGVTVPSGTIRLPSDEIPASAFGLSQIPAGRLLHVKCIMQVSAAGKTLPYSQRGTSDGGGAQVGWYNAADTQVSSVDTPGAFTRTGTSVDTASNGFCPIVRGRFVRPITAFMGLGDSIMEITADGTPQVMGRAFFQKAMRNAASDGGYRPSLMAAKVGIQTGALASSPFWKEYLDAVDVVITEPGTNDFGGSTVSQMQAMLTNLWDAIKPSGKEIYQTNWQPRTDSSDSWATQAGQTPRSAWVTGGVRDQVIAWLQTKVQDGTLAGVIDTLSATQFLGDGTLPADNSRWDTATGRVTSDGTHPYGSMMERMAVPLRTAIAKYPINGL